MALSENSSGLSRDNVTLGEPVPYTIKLFIPTALMIHSAQITDMINGRRGEVIIATSFGLSTYNGSWSTRHINLNNISEGMMDDYVTAVEYDHSGNLWIGYSGGLQINNGIYYQSIRDQQLLKETRIHDLQRWDDDMWIATGHAGIHRYRDGTWTWFQP
ncbi:MAG: two-component regulator propeller domain-containing protein, partial [bacterium]